ncbi:MAG: site-specific integrase [Candidatus Moranbacteria bacterium]|nr:site-specific integrase [Candidatus Moranbacteria bacterium]
MSWGEHKSGKFYVQYREPGSQKVIFEYFSTKQEAMERDLEVKLLKKRGQLKQREEALYLDMLVQSYIDDAKMRNMAIETLKTYATIFKNDILPILALKPIKDLTYSDCIPVLQKWSDKKNSTRNRYTQYLNTVFEFGIRHGMIDNNPLKNWRKSKEEKLKYSLSLSDLQKIIENAPGHLQWAIEVEFNLGLRPGTTELFSLKWVDIDFDNNLVHVKGTKTAGANRKIPITDSFANRLREKKLASGSEYVITYKGKPVTQVRKSLNTARKKAGIDYPVRMYDIRHLFASVMLSGGADLAAVSKLLGHASTKMTADTYYQLLKGEKERAVNLLPTIHTNLHTNGLKMPQKVCINGKKIQ